MALASIDSDRPSYVASFDEDPVLARVQASLASEGGDFSSMPVSAGPAGGGTGQEMMMAMIAQKTAEQPSAPAGNYEHEEGSSLGWVIGAGVAGLAVGAGVGALIAGSGGDDKKAKAAPAPATDAGHPAQPGGGGRIRSANSAAGAPQPKPAAAPEAKAAAEFGTVGLTDMLSKPKTDRNGNIAWSESPKAAKPTPSPVAAAKVDLSMFRPQITVLPAPAETGAAGTVLPPPRPDEAAAGASLPPPAASTGPDVSLLDQ